jgi:hypothetical protein
VAVIRPAVRAAVTESGFDSHRLHLLTAGSEDATMSLSGKDRPQRGFFMRRNQTIFEDRDLGAYAPLCAVLPDCSGGAPRVEVSGFKGGY